MPSPPMRRVIVTRPREQAGEWLQRLRAHGLDAVALPLIDIGPPRNLAPVLAAWDSLPSRHLVVFVSPSAAQHFFDATVSRGQPWPPALAAAATGPGTARVLRAQGLPQEALVTPPAEAPQFDSEHLWPVLATTDWRGRSALIVRGADEGDGAESGQGAGRHVLGEYLRQAGARVDHVAAYQRGLPALVPSERELLAQALQHPESHVWLLSSSQAVDHLQQLCAVHGLPGDTLGCAVATHPRIAEAARAAGFHPVHTVRPDVDTLVTQLHALC